MPSMVTLLLVVRCPLTLMSTVARPDVRTSGGSVLVPGERPSRNRKFGSANGRAVSVWLSIGSPVVGFCVLMSVPAA